MTEQLTHMAAPEFLRRGRYWKDQQLDASAMPATLCGIRYKQYPCGVLGQVEPLWIDNYIPGGTIITSEEKNVTCPTCKRADVTVADIDRRARLEVMRMADRSHLPPAFTFSISTMGGAR